MINPAELRKGNLLQAEMTWPVQVAYIVRVKQILDHGIATDIVDNVKLPMVSNTEYSGIPLNGEWLKRFGFKWNYDHYRLNDVSIASEDGVNYGIWDHELMIPIHDATKYVHQLQNLYFALTQKELDYEH